jgi:hypothetical protein
LGSDELQGVSLAEGFAKRYELHYQPRKIEVEGLRCKGNMGA